ncbi:MAG TPA: hypothetical protein VEJ36_00460 [Nitrososphaerales archaeon]|nr:hypothetical protein [Nitrososphaerales archaeon]
MQNVHGKWSGRFIWAAVAQGLIAVIVTILIVEPQSFFNISSYYSPSRVIASGGGGTWLFTGYISYLTVGVIAVAVTAIFYYYIEEVQGKVYHGLANILAWGHFVFMNVGVAAAMLLMIWGGYLAGWAGAPIAAGGLNYTDYQIHVHYLSQLVNPIGGFIVLACVGALLGGLGFLLVRFQKK